MKTKGGNSVIVLAGMIGAGKSTYTKLISDRLGSEAFYESVEDNRILEMFYSDPKRWAFALQIYFLNTRFRAIKDALNDRNNVLDRSIYEDALFCRVQYEAYNNITDAEYDTYLDLLDNMMEELNSLEKKSPDLLIYLKGDFETILNRIKKRGRSYEQIESNPELLQYYKELHSRYDGWVAEYDKSPVLTINIEDFDVENPEDAEKVMEIVHSKLAELEKETA